MKARSVFYALLLACIVAFAVADKSNVPKCQLTDEDVAEGPTPLISPQIMAWRFIQVSTGLIAAIIGFGFIVGFAFYVLSQPDGNSDDEMLREIAGYIHDGAKTFLKKEYIALSAFVIMMCILVGALFAILESCCLGPEVSEVQDNLRQLKLDRLSGLWVVISLLLGAGFSAAAGWLGMFIATKSNIRTTHACRESMGAGLSVAFKSGAVMGLTVCCLGLTGLSILYLAFSSPAYFLRPWTYIAGFGFGASSIALFARVGGGVYTKAADVGADLVGKVENNIPEDDVRNPAVIADNVGDNVGDVAGMGADLFESYCGSIIAACSLAAVTVVQTNTQSCNTKCGNLASEAALHRGCIYGIPALGTKPMLKKGDPVSYWFEYCPGMYKNAPLHYLPTSKANNDQQMSCTGWGTNGMFYYHLFALPFWIAGVGVLASIVGVFAVSTDEEAQQPSHEMSTEEKNKHDVEQLEKLLWKTRIGVIVAAVLSLIFSFIVCVVLFSGSEGSFEYRFFFCMVIGLIAGIFIGVFTEYCTSYSYFPTRSIAQSSETGPATVIIRGLGVGMISCAVPTVILVVAILASDELAGVYGIAIAAVGMLSTLGVTLATDAYGPVADNAGGIAEMVDTVAEHVRDRTDALDALGNTTAATGKGFAIGSAVLTSVGLITAFMEEAGLTGGVAIDLKEPAVLAGILIGAMLPYLFAALTMLSVGSSAESIILQVRLQFYRAKKENEHINPGWWDVFTPTEWAEAKGVDPYLWYETCIAVSTNAALREMILPGLIAVFAPAIIGFLLGTGALAGLLVGALTSGFMLAIMMANAGGAWDNAKKFCEKELLGPGKGKHTKYHDATVVGDTVGDPFKDTSGPALNILIKLMSIISLVLAPVFFLLYGAEVRPFLGNDSRTVEGWVGPVIGLIILVAVMILCVIFTMINNKKMREFKENVEAEYQAVKDSTEDVSRAVNADFPFVVVTVLKFKSQDGAKEYEDAFAILAESRRDFASTYLLTKVRDEKGDDEQPEYIEFIVFRNSEAFRQHRLTVTEGTSQMKQAMNEHVVLDAVTINAFGQIDDQERAVLNMMGANIFEHHAGYVNLEADGNVNPVPVLSRFKCQSQEDVENYCRAFATTASKMHDYASTYVLTKDPNDDDGLGMSEILIYRSADAFVNHAKLDVIKNELGPALAKYLVQDSVRVTVIGQPPGSEVEQTLKAVNAAYTDLQAGFIS